VAAPIRNGEEVEVRIDSLAYGGSGVARLDGFVLFVRGALPGDLVRARATKVKRGFAEATRTALLEPGEGRVEAPCRHFGTCGGCRFQDYEYERQIAAKELQVRDALVRLGKFGDPPVEPIVPADSRYHYRNKLEYSFASGDNGPILGFHRAGRWDEVIDIEECLLTTELGNAIREAVKRWAREESLEPYDQESGAGYLRHLVVREGRNTGDVLVVLVTAPGERFDADFLVETLTAFPDVKSIHWAVNDRPAEVTNLPTRVLWGNEWIEEELCGLRFRVRPNAFLQTNTVMAETLYSLARQGARLSGQETLYDLYCGTGTIGLSLAGSAKSVWGVEISEESVACAIENADANGIANASFFAGNVGQSLEELRDRAGPPDVVVVDPPRAGLAGKALRRTGALQAPRIVYVSCNPTTLASDLAVLRDEFGYRLEQCTPVDMFPHTPHIESVSALALPIDRRAGQNASAAE
jgi:23S rRNA (uracil1939-C5)-methyltransferase